MVDPASSREYAEAGGYQALRRAIEAPDQVIPELKESGLRGRGGSGFPIGVKWELVRNTPAEQKYVVCNADESEPGTCKDRFALMAVPHALIEGMAVCGAAVGADKGCIYLRGEYSDVREMLESAIADAYANGYLGQGILGTGFSFDLEIRLGHGSYVCGEETAQLESIEGGRGEPRPRPPLPGVAGLWGAPTVINNVETFLNVPVVMDLGAKEYRKYGTEKSPGTKLITLSGNICRPGVYEFPMGITVGELFTEVGGGCPDGKKLLGVQVGGGSGVFIGPEILDVSFDFENMAGAGAVFGTGSLMFFDEDNNILDLCVNTMEFFSDESCGKCVPCREGCRILLGLLRKIKEGQGTPEDLEKLQEMGEHMKKSALCGFGQAAPVPLLTAMDGFSEAFRSAVKPVGTSLVG